MIYKFSGIKINEDTQYIIIIFSNYDTSLGEQCVEVVIQSKEILNKTIIELMEQKINI